MPEETIHLTLRLPSDLRDEIAALAKEDERSLNAEVVFALRTFARSRRPKPADSKGEE